MKYESASPESRYDALVATMGEDIDFLVRSIRRARRWSLAARFSAVFLLVIASIIPLLGQVAPQSIPPWLATLAIVLAGGMLMLDRIAMWTEDFTRWNARYIETLAFRDAFQSKYALTLRSRRDAGVSPDEQLLELLANGFESLSAIRNAEASSWAVRYASVLNALSGELRGRLPETRA